MSSILSLVERGQALPGGLRRGRPREVISDLFINLRRRAALPRLLRQAIRLINHREGGTVQLMFNLIRQRSWRTASRLRQLLLLALALPEPLRQLGSPFRFIFK